MQTLLAERPVSVAATRAPRRAAETFVLVHSSASSPRQWRALIDALAARGRVFGVELRGHGTQPAWPAERPLALADDVAQVEPLLAGGDGAHLIGHSYGAAVALAAAARQPQRVRSVVAFEPVLFRWLFEDDAASPAARDVAAVAEAVRRAVYAGRPRDAAERFVDFWSGPGSFARAPRDRQDDWAERMPIVQKHFAAVTVGAPAPARLAAVDAPMLFLSGERTVATTRRIAELLRAALPKATHETMPGLGHLGPITHAADVNRRTLRFLREEVPARETV